MPFLAAEHLEIDPDIRKRVLVLVDLLLQGCNRLLEMIDQVLIGIALIFRFCGAGRRARRAYAARRRVSSRDCRSSARRLSVRRGPRCRRLLLALLRWPLKYAFLKDKAYQPGDS